jgi:hypothetical protein
VRQTLAGSLAVQGQEFQKENEMKRIITIKGSDEDVTFEVRATVKTTNLARYESEKVVNALANRLFDSIDNIPYASFGVHNTTVSV